MALSYRRTAIVYRSSLDYLLHTQKMDMENARLTSNSSKWESILTHPLVVSITLLMLCVGLHRSVLSAGWRFDDGAHLYFAATYSPWEYFFIPEIIRQQSWANFTPFNALFYDLGLPLFGLNPTGHYAHMLLVLWLTAIVTYFLLRLWFTALTALLSAALFITMPATSAIAQMLMTGHYAYGLLFSVLMFLCFAQGLQKNDIRFTLSAALFYALACWSKELYVPLIAVLLFLPVDDWKKRFFHLRPFILVAIVYTIYRVIVLEGIGGYGTSSLSGSPKVLDVLNNISLTFFVHEQIRNFSIAYLFISLIVAVLFQDKRISLIFFTATIIVISLPILSLLKKGFFGDVTGIRLFYLIGWASVAWLAWLVNSNKFHSWTLIALIICFISTQSSIASSIRDLSIITEQQNLFLLKGTEKQVLLPFEFDHLNKLDSLQRAKLLIQSQSSPVLLRNMEELKELSQNQKEALYKFKAECNCIQSISDAEYSDLLGDFNRRLAKGAEQVLNVSLDIENLGHLKLFRWKFEGGEGNYDLYIREFEKIELPPSGWTQFGLDVTVSNSRIYGKNHEFHLFVQLTSPKGWIARTPIFAINPNIANQVSWSGKSAVVWNTD